MKNCQIIALAVIALLATSCSTTTFTEYRGQGTFDGAGGTVRTVKGIDFWENGRPDRKYQIIGVIDDSRKIDLFTPGNNGAIAKVAHENGGDAVILARSAREFQGTDMLSGDAKYNRVTKVWVVKYISEESQQPVQQTEADLKVRAITGSAGRRIAVINNMTMMVGDHANVRQPDGSKIPLSCVEIGEDYVIVQIKGVSSPKKLVLGQQK